MADTSFLNAAIERAATLLGTQPARAEREIAVVLKALPNDPRAPC